MLASPALKPTPMNALTACGTCVIPVDCRQQSLMAVPQLLEVLANIAEETADLETAIEVRGNGHNRSGQEQAEYRGRQLSTLGCQLCRGK